MHRRLREARGLSQGEAAVTASEMRGLDTSAKPVTLDQIHNYETGRASRVRYMPAILDRAYGGFGWTCYERVAAKTVLPGRFRVVFPRFWLGPVCVTASPPAGDPFGGEIAFAWSKWRLVRNLPAKATSFTFYCMPGAWTLDVQVRPGWKIEAHMGQNPDALDANGDWVPVDETASNEIFDQFVVGWLRTVGQTSDNLARALGYEARPDFLSAPDGE